MRAALALAVACMVSTVLVIGFAVDRPPLAADVLQEAEHVSVSASRDGEAVPAVLTVTALEPAQLLSPRSGTVTSVEVRAGDRLDAAVLIATVDDVPVVTQIGSAPIVAEVGASSPTAAIRRLQGWLAAAGHDVETDGRWGSQTARAVRDAVADLTGRRGATTFPAGLLTWVGDAPWQVEEVVAHVGDVIEPGQVLAVGPTLRASTTVSLGAGVSLDDASPWLITREDVAVPISRFLDVDPVDAASLLRGTGVAVDDAVNVIITRAVPLRTAALPAAAIVQQGESACVAVHEGDGAYTPLEVDVVGTGVGQVTVRWPEDVTADVLLNPDAVPAFTCQHPSWGSAPDPQPT